MDSALTYRLTIPDAPTADDRDAVLAPLRAFNVAQAGDPRIKQVAILLSDADGATQGGLWGRIAYDWLFVELLGLPDAARGAGLGRQIMERAEAIAREADCEGIWLDTFEFQARGFYEKLGYELFGTLGDYPTGHKRFFLQKRLK